MYLRHWRGRGAKSATARRYNRVAEGGYVRMPWYIDKILYATLWERAVHSGESISRMLDFAIRYYLPRLLEEYLRSSIPGIRRSERNSPYWERRYASRFRPQAELFIIYQCLTEKNDGNGLIYSQVFSFLSKSELFNAQIYGYSPGFP
ncbi:MAG: hypothetical protein OHK0011_17560 [Turneriella sp.]